MGIDNQIWDNTERVVMKMKEGKYINSSEINTIILGLLDKNLELLDRIKKLEEKKWKNLILVFL